MSGLLIAGAGGHGRVVAEAAEASGGWSTIAFIDDGFAKSTIVDDWPVLGRLEDAGDFSGDFEQIVVAIGNNQYRLNWLRRYANSRLTLASVIHPRAVISPRATIGAGTVVFAGAVINTGAALGSGCIINTGAVVDHDCTLGEAVHISPGANLAGEVSVGNCSWVGIGASIRHQIRLGSNVVVGAGAAVVNNFDDNLTLIGVPARSIKAREAAGHDFL